MSDDNPTKVITLPVLAKELGIDRSTLVRLEQRGVISKAPFVGFPVQGRVYDAALVRTVKAEFGRYTAKKLAEQVKRPAAPEAFVLVDRL